jgi:hypothetical protein
LSGKKIELIPPVLVIHFDNQDYGRIYQLQQEKNIHKHLKNGELLLTEI